MNPADPLQALHPLRTPEAIGWWPPAPGWWLLALTVLALAAVLLLALRRRQRRNRYRHEALRELGRLRASGILEGDPARALIAINATLKRAAISAAGRDRVADLSGEAWAGFLNASQGDSAPAFEATWFDAGYRRSGAGDVPVATVLERAERWLRRHRTPAC